MANPTGAAAANYLSTAAKSLAPAPSRRAALDRGEVMLTALRIVDEEDLSALTIRRLAGELGVGVQTIYSVAGGKEAILNGIVEQMLSQLPPLPTDDENWEEVLLDHFIALHELFIAHSSVAHLALLRRITGPVSLGTQDAIFRLLRASGIDEAMLLPAYGATASLVMGCTMLRIARAEDPLLQQKGPTHGFPAAEFPEVLALAPQIDAHVTSEGLRDWLRRLLSTFHS